MTTNSQLFLKKYVSLWLYYDYGTYLIKNLAKQLEPEYGSGFSVRQLEMCCQFCRIYPIANALRSQLNWMQYKLLIAIDNTDKKSDET